MTLNLIKLCVGADTIEDLANWQKSKVKEAKKKGRKPEILHVTRMTPKRDAELLAGGSLYWVIKGQICVRQGILGLKNVVRDGGPRCGIVLDPKLVLTKRRTHRAFQGWRYLDSKDAPPDLSSKAHEANIPEELRAELTALGLL